jgi:hypothetical protein
MIARLLTVLLIGFALMGGTAAVSARSAAKAHACQGGCK